MRPSRRPTIAEKDAWLDTRLGSILRKPALVFNNRCPRCGHFRTSRVHRAACGPKAAA